MAERQQKRKTALNIHTPIHSPILTPPLRLPTPLPTRTRTTLLPSPLPQSQPPFAHVSSPADTALSGSCSTSPPISANSSSSLSIVCPLGLVRRKLSLLSPVPRSVPTQRQSHSPHSRGRNRTLQPQSRHSKSVEHRPVGHAARRENLQRAKLRPPRQRGRTEGRGGGRKGGSTSPRHFGLNPWFATMDSRSALIVITIRPSENSVQISSFLRRRRCQSGGRRRGDRGVLLQRDLHRNDDRHWVDDQDQVRDDVAYAYITPSVYFSGGGVGEPRTHDVELFLRGFTATYGALLAERGSIRRGGRSLLAGDG